ncbi:MAG: PilC/PilY family type IV pilus protein [Pyramidobacter sp.]|nr:PilC/PilY family type IV pilus protein [Pyramidobacter sp.]
MKTLMTFLLCLYLSGCSAAALPEFSVQERNSETLAPSTAWETTCVLLSNDSDEQEECVYLGLRRRIDGKARDAGRFEKYVFGADEAGQTVWSSQVTSPRKTLVAPCDEGGVPVRGKLQLLSDYSPFFAAFSGIAAEQWDELISRTAQSSVSASWPPAMALSDTTLFVHCDDGRLCAFDASTGNERWSFFPPQACRVPRLKTALSASETQPLPWLLSGGITLERCSNDEGLMRVLLFGALGLGGRGVYCLDVTDSESPEFLWAREDFQEGESCSIWGSDAVSESVLGFVQAAPIAAQFDGEVRLVIPAGVGTAGKIVTLDAWTGKTLNVSLANDSSGAFVFRPCGLSDARGELAHLIQCDNKGALLVFDRDGNAWKERFRVNFRRIADIESLDFIFEPIPCVLDGELWIACAASASHGTFIAASPVDELDSQWQEMISHKKDRPWWLCLDGFSDVSSILFYDGALYLLGRESGEAALKIVSLRSGGVIDTTPVSDGIKRLLVQNGTIMGINTSSTQGSVNFTVFAARPASSSRIYYTLCR